MRHASLFSGIGGPEVAAAMLGWENAFHCEINPFGRTVLEYWFPESKSYEDITKTSFKEWRGRIDVLTGGFPCQPFSYAGKRGGRDDERYLWPEMLRVIDEVRPTWVVGENVAGITTMVEGGLLADLGCDSSLFSEGDDVHRYELEQSHTIERICGDLERLGYDVQPVLIPAAAVGAPHRRDRVFIIAFDADTYRRHDEGEAGEHEGACRGEGIQERDEVWEPRISDQLRSEIQGITSDTDGSGRGEVHEQIQPEFTYGEESLSDWRERHASDSKGEQGHQCGYDVTEPCQQEPCELGGRSGEESAGRDSADAFREGLEGEDESGYSEGGERVCVRRDATGHGWPSDIGLIPGNRWAEFPTVSPVHRGNDGLPFSLDDLAIPQAKWRTESLKAYGNAIVPQVMYRIFQTIEKITRLHELKEI